MPSLIKKKKVLTKKQRKTQKEYQIMMQEKLPANIGLQIDQVKTELQQKYQPIFSISKSNFNKKQTWGQWLTGLTYNGLMLTNSNQDIRAKYIKTSITSNTFTNNPISNNKYELNSTYNSLAINNKTMEFLNGTEIIEKKHKGKSRKKRSLRHLLSKITKKIEKYQKQIKESQEKVEKQQFEWEKQKNEPKQILVREEELQAARKNAADANWRAAADEVCDLETDLTSALEELDKIREKLSQAIKKEEEALLSVVIIEAKIATATNVINTWEIKNTNLRAARAELEKAKARLETANAAEIERTEEIKERTTAEKIAADKEADKELEELLNKEINEAKSELSKSTTKVKIAEDAVKQAARETEETKEAAKTARAELEKAKERLETANEETRQVRREVDWTKELETIRKNKLAEAEAELDTAAEQYQKLEDPNKLNEWQKDYETSVKKEEDLFNKYNEHFNKMQELRKKKITKIQKQPQESNQDVKEKVKEFVDTTAAEIETDNFTKSKMYFDRREALKEVQEKFQQLNKKALEEGDFEKIKEYQDKIEAKKKYQEKIKQLGKQAEMNAEKIAKEESDFESLVKRAKEEREKHANQLREQAETSNPITSVKTKDQIIIEKLAEKNRQRQAKLIKQPNEKEETHEEQPGTSKQSTSIVACCDGNRQKRSLNSPDCVPCPTNTEEKPSKQPSEKEEISVQEEKIPSEVETKLEADASWAFCMINLIEPNHNLTLPQVTIPLGTKNITLDQITDCMPSGSVYTTVKNTGEELAQIGSGFVNMVKGKQKITVERLGSTIGSCAGIIAGAEAGAAVCTPIAPGVGTLICGFVGAVIGDILGGKGGEKIKQVLDNMADKWDETVNKLDEKAIHDINISGNEIRKMNATEQKKVMDKYGNAALWLGGREVVNNIFGGFMPN